MPRGYLDSIETQVRQLQEENKALRQSLAAAQAAVQQETSSSGSNGGGGGGGDGSSNVNPDRPSDMDTSFTTVPVSPPSTQAGSASPPENAVAVEVGYLSLIATGETRYLGSSSGLGLANIINTLISAHTGMDQETPESADSRTVRVGVSDTSLPPLLTAKPFIEAYFQHTHITFPLLHRPSFLATVGRIYDEPGFYERDAYAAFVFDMVLAIGSSNFNRFDESMANSRRYFAMAQSKLGRVLSLDGLTSLKAILLISQHGIFSNLRDTSASTWHLVGIGARICFELGLHLEQKQQGITTQDQQRCNPIALERELRKRCFWCLYNLDRVVSFTLGRPVVIRDEEIDVQLPSHLDDDCFSLDPPVVAPPLGDASSNNQVSPFLHLIRIRRLSGQILTQFYNSRQHAHIPIEEKTQIRRRLHAEINSWRNDTRHLPNVCSSNSEAGYMSSFLSLDWYHAVYNNAILLLYRPSPFLPHPSIRSIPGDGEPELVQLLGAARSSIESYSQLHQKRRLNYSWITLHGVFIAGLAYTYSVARLLRDSTALSLVPELFSIVEVTRSCSNVLVAICERWDASRRSCDLFNNLSNAVIRDALKVLSKQTQGISSQESSRPSFVTANMESESETLDSPRRAQRRAEENMQYDSTVMDDVMNPAIQLDDNFTMEEFRLFMGSLNDGNFDLGSASSELVSGFSQDWPFDTTLGVDTSFSSSGFGDGTNLNSW
ncbi:hypothetical protein MBLNU459_g2827t1 [Dothideomycetes sp. NU459]